MRSSTPRAHDGPAVRQVHEFLQIPPEVAVVAIGKEGRERNGRTGDAGIGDDLNGVSAVGGFAEK